MPSKLKTAIEFVKHIRTTGAINQTSKRTEEEITQQVVETSKLVVEFGMGHGNITEKILTKLPKDGRLFAFEVNSEFCEVVKDTIDDDRLTIVNDSAANIAKYVDKDINNIISSMPLTMFSDQLVADIFKSSFSLLKDTGYFSQILYNKNSRDRFDQYFSDIDITGIISFPPQFVYHCTDKVM